MKGQLEARENMKKVCQEINDMVCFVFNTVEVDIDDADLPVVTKLIFKENNKELYY